MAININATVTGFIYVVIVRDPSKRDHACVAFEREDDAVAAVGAADRAELKEGFSWFYVQIPVMKMK